MSYSRSVVSALFFAFVFSVPVVTAASAQEAGPEGPPSRIKNYGTWSTRCLTNPQNQKDVCHAFVEIERSLSGDDADKKARVLLLNIGYHPKGEGMLVVALAPLGVVLPVGIGYQVDDGSKFGGPFAFCVPYGCQSDLLLDEQKLEEIKNGKVLKVFFTGIRQGNVEIPVGLDGITAALGALPKP